MSNLAQKLDYGFVCPVRGCDKKKNRRFSSVVALCKHMEVKHKGEAGKRLRAKKAYR